MSKKSFLNSIKSPWLYGFIISLLGSLPLGYINVIGLQITLQQGTLAAIYFILGIVFVEIFVLKITSSAAHWLVSQKKLLLFIDIFTIVFFSAIAYYFFTNSEGATQNFSLSSLKLSSRPFLLGLLLNTLNFIQWPYWSGVYLYLYRSQHLDLTTKAAKNYFILAALIGTALGMLLFSQVGKLLLKDHKNDFNSYLNLIFAILFLALALFQAGKFCYKLLKNKQ